MLHEEKRIRQLHGPKRDLKYQIKLNDVVLDKAEQRSRSTELEYHGTHQGGRLIRGSNFNEEATPVPDNLKERNSDLFGLKRLHQVGPSDYDPNKVTKNSPKVVIKQSLVDQSQGGSVKKQMESYLGKIFDQDGGKRDKGAASEQPTLIKGGDSKQLDKMQPFTSDKRDMSFKSKVPRDPMDPSK